MLYNESDETNSDFHLVTVKNQKYYVYRYEGCTQQELVNSVLLKKDITKSAALSSWKSITVFSYVQGKIMTLALL